MTPGVRSREVLGLESGVISEEETGCAREKDRRRKKSGKRQGVLTGVGQDPRRLDHVPRRSPTWDRDGEKTDSFDEPERHRVD